MKSCLHVLLWLVIQRQWNHSQSLNTFSWQKLFLHNSIYFQSTNLIFDIYLSRSLFNRLGTSSKYLFNSTDLVFIIVSSCHCVMYWTAFMWKWFKSWGDCYDKGSQLLNGCSVIQNVFKTNIRSCSYCIGVAHTGF